MKSYPICSAKEVLDSMAAKMDKDLETLASAGMTRCVPELAPEKGEDYWLKQPGAPKPKLANEKPQGQTIAYEELLKTWKSH